MDSSFDSEGKSVVLFGKIALLTEGNSHFLYKTDSSIDFEGKLLVLRWRAVQLGW